MDYIREWVLKIAGIIILLSASDMIMLEGEMKKYIKPVLGIILVVTVLRPVLGDARDKFDVLENYSASYEGTLLADTRARDRQNIKRMYEKRLSQEMQKLLLNRYGLKTEITITALDKTSDFGEIENVEVTIKDDEKKVSQTELINYIEKNFGASKNKIKVFGKEMKEEVIKDAF